jgi:AcrR family transcriptional regulator
MARRTGRRPGNPDTREAILVAARDAFAERGFDGASIRAIATSAGVDPALVHHYFGAKEQLFLAAMRLPVNPGELLPDVVAEGPERVGERLLRTFLTVWDSPAGTAGAAMLRSATSSEWSARLLREFLTTQILRRVQRMLGLPASPETQLRLSLAASQMMGLAMARYIIKVEPMASAPRETLVQAIAPTIQRYLTGDIAALAADRAGSAEGLG